MLKHTSKGRKSSSLLSLHWRDGDTGQMLWLEGELGGTVDSWEGMHSRNFQRRTQGVGSRQSWCAKTQRRLWRLKTASMWMERPEDKRTRSAVAIMRLRPLGTPNFKMIRQVKSPLTMFPSNPASAGRWGQRRASVCWQ